MAVAAAARRMLGGGGYSRRSSLVSDTEWSESAQYPREGAVGPEGGARQPAPDEELPPASDGTGGLEGTAWTSPSNQQQLAIGLDAGDVPIACTAPESSQATVPDVTGASIAATARRARIVGLRVEARALRAALRSVAAAVQEFSASAAAAAAAAATALNGSHAAFAARRAATNRPRRCSSRSGVQDAARTSPRRARASAATLRSTRQSVSRISRCSRFSVSLRTPTCGGGVSNTDSCEGCRRSLRLGKDNGDALERSYYCGTRRGIGVDDALGKIDSAVACSDDKQEQRRQTNISLCSGISTGDSDEPITAFTSRQDRVASNNVDELVYQDEEQVSHEGPASYNEGTRACHRSKRPRSEGF